MKRALILTYYWPPAGGPGVQRWLNFVKYLREFDVEPVVYTPENPHYPIIDSDFEDQIPEGLEVLKYPVSEPYRYARLFSKQKTRQMSSGIISEKKPSFIERLLLYIRGNFFIPDARIGWVEPSVRYLSQYLKEHPTDLVITTGPPHSLHLIGRKLQHQMSVRWIADFRDPWTTIHYHKSLQLTKASEAKHQRLEAEILQNADHIIVTSKTTKKEFSEKTDRPITVITNGYVAGDAATAKLDTDFSISHIGSLLSERNPEILWEVLSELVKEDEIFAQKLKIRLTGSVSDEVLESLETKGLKDFCEISGYLSHSEAIRAQQRSQLLLLVEMNRPETKAIIPGKLFEYLAAKRPILALGPSGSDIEEIIEETSSGVFFTYLQKQKIREALLLYFKAYLEDRLFVISHGIEKYDRRNLTKNLAEIIHML